MIEKRDVQITKTITTWHCDLCDYSTEVNSGCCGIRNVMSCYVCGKDCCRKHTNHYQEDSSSDYDDAQVCDECNPRFSVAWEWALDNAGRYAEIYEVAIKVMEGDKDG